MKKQTDFQFRVLEYNSITPGQSSADWSQYIKENYLDAGWEVLSAEVIRAEANSVFLGISFVKYQTVADESFEVDELARPKRGRPRKEVAKVDAAN